MDNNRKGIILAGGSGSRLYPITNIFSKQLMPVYDKPMIYYPLSTLMLSNIREVLIITTPRDEENFINLLGDGSQWGMKIQYTTQTNPDGLAQAFIIGKSFINNGNTALILGDNIFYGHGLERILQKANSHLEGACIFAHHVDEPSRYGVIDFDQKNKVRNIIEKPEKPKSNYAVTGLYFYDKQVCDIAAELKPSARGELEITDVNNYYLKKDILNVEILEKDYTWLDTGTHKSFLEASNFVSSMQKCEGLLIACPEEISFRQGWITSTQLEEQAYALKKNDYGQYLLNIIK